MSDLSPLSGEERKSNFGAVRSLMTQLRHWLCNAAMVLIPVSAPFKILV